MRCLVALWLVLVMLAAGFAIVPGSLAVAAPAVAGARGGDVPVVPAVPLDGVGDPADPAEETVPLPNGPADLPSDEVSSVVAESTWTDVPQMPVDVRVPDGLLANDPASPLVEDSPAADPAPLEPSDQAGDEPSSEPTDASSEGGGPVEPSDAPSDGLSDPAGDPTPVPDSTVAPEAGPEGPVSPGVEVSLTRPDDLARGVLLFSVAPQTTGGSGAEDSTGDSAADDADDGADDGADEEGGSVLEGADLAGIGLRIDYSSFDTVYGGAWSDRLVVRAYPACYEVTPEAEGCAGSISVPAVNDTDADTLRFATISTADLAEGLTELADDSSTSTGADTDPSGSSAAVAAAEDGVVYALASAPGGYGPTPTSPAGEWQVGVGSGEFAYSYPFELPSSVAGSTPGLGLEYSSAAVDGMTTAANGQASPAGVGWVLEPGHISRSYKTCDEDTTSSTEIGAGKFDQCWRTVAGEGPVEELTLSLNGQVARLVPTENGDRFRLKDDLGWRIDRFRAASSPAADRPDNADNDNEGFRVTTPDGTEYWFGYGRNATDSVWTAPVYANDPGEPCWDTSVVRADRFCQQGWRWNLDRVVDPSGNTTRYSYVAERNNYSRWGNTGSSNWTTPYDRGGLLTKIEYGFRGADAPRQVVNLSRLNRCIPQLTDPTATCGSAKNNQAAWPDVPGDLVCHANNSGCATSPSFFTTNRYHEVKTSVKVGTSMDVIDQYRLGYTLPDPDGSAGDAQRDLWLNTITRTGHTGSGTLELPVVEFDGIPKPNKIPAWGEAYEKFRIGSVLNETGGRIDVTYGHATGRDCTWAYVDSIVRWSSTRECFAQRTRRTSDPSTYEVTWYHKYVVTRVAVGDHTLGLRLGTPASNPVSLGKVGVYDYEYSGAPAWRFAGSRNTPTAVESWTDWRGYETTIVHTRATTANGALGAGDVARQRVTRFRGMHLAPAHPTQVENGSIARPERRVTSVQHITDPTAQPLDRNLLDGLTAETQTLTGGGALIGRTYTDYDAIQTAETTTEHPRQARIRFANWTETATALDAGGTRLHRIDYKVQRPDATHDRLGITIGTRTGVHDKGDPTTNTDDTCAATTWQADAGSWIRVPATVALHDGACPDPDTGQPGGPGVARASTTYDGGGPLTRGLPTDTFTWLTPTGDPASGTDVIHTATAYDAFGRVIRTTGPGDTAHELVTETTYNPGGNAADALTGLQVTQIDVLQTARTTPASPTTATQDTVTTTIIEPGRGLPTQVTDPNGGITRIGYNPLGQPTEVRYPGQGPAAPASVIYQYLTSQNDPSRVQTRTLREITSTNNAIYDDSYTFHDGWGRQVETQIPQPETPTARIVSVTGYDEQGLVRYTMPAVPNGGGFGTVLNPDPNGSPGGVDQYTVTDYDAAGRPTSVTEKSKTTTLATTTTDYRGDAVVVDPPTGGNTLTEIDRWDRPTRVQLHAAANTLPGSLADAVDYTYTPRGELETATKTLAGGTYAWSYGYDQTGRRLWAHDPDTGVTTTTYDDAGNPRRITTGPIDSLNQALDLTDPYHPVVTAPSSVIETTYDRLGRPQQRLDQTDVEDPETDQPTTITTWGYDDPDVDNSIGLPTSTVHPITGIEPLLDGVLTDAGAHETNVIAYDTQGQATHTSETYPRWLTSELPDNDPNHPNNTVTHETTTHYNEGGMVEQIDHPALPGLPAASIDHTYTTGGRLRAITLDEAGTPLRLAHAVYNNIGRTLNLTSGAFTTTNLTTGTLKTGLARDYSWEPDTGRLDTTSATITPATTSGAPGSAYQALELDHEYDPGGNPTLIKGAATDPGATEVTGAWCYTYDGLNRLATAKTGAGTNCTNPATAPTAVTGATYDLTYGYAADRLAQVTDNLHNTGGSDPAPLRVTYATADATGGLRPHHSTSLDGNPSLTSLLSWPDELPPLGALYNDDHGRVETWIPDLLGLTVPPDTGPTSGAYTYRYDRLGNLTSTTPQITAAANSSIQHTYRPGGTRLATRTFSPLDVGGLLTSTTVDLTDGTKVTRHGLDLNTTRTFTTPGGTPIATQQGNATSTGTAGTNHDADWTWLHADAQNSIRVSYTHNPTGPGTLNRHHYFPFGDPTTTGPPETPTDVGYLNKTHDITGDIRLDHRNYTPHLNQLTTPDPLLAPGDPQSFNPYAYARNNPVGLEDPSGLKPPCADRIGGTCNYDPNENKVTDYEPDTSPAPPEGPPSVQQQTQNVIDQVQSPEIWDEYAPQVILIEPWIDDPPPEAILQVAVEWCGQNNDVLCSDEVWNELYFQRHPKGIPGRDGGGVLGPPRGAEILSPDGCSFTGATVVLMADGTKKPIEDIEVGDRVIATDPETGEQVAKRVTHVWVHDDTVIDLVVDGEVITTTEDHPFWSVIDQRFERADELSPGETVLGADGRVITVSGLVLGTSRKALAYNLSIEGIHTYHVGEARILVHNTCPIKPVNLPAWRKVSIDMEHISSGHMIGGSRVSPRKDLFPDSMTSSQVESAVRQAYRYSGRVATQGDFVLARGSADGLTIEMWVNRQTRTIETAYPIAGP